ncbi:MAG: hypothetical protein ACQBVK_01785 [Candidatus Phytoplasma sp. TWB_XP]
MDFIKKSRKNPIKEDAYNYLKYSLNPALDFLPLGQEFRKANRTLENLWKAANRFSLQKETNETLPEDKKLICKI